MDRTTCSTEKNKLLGYFTFNNLNLVDNDAAKPLSTNKVQLLGYFLLSTIQLVLGIDGTAQPVAQKSELLG
jgi:hypothetical protein